MHSKPQIFLRQNPEIQPYELHLYERSDVMSCPHSPDDSPIPFPDSSPQHSSESSDDSGCDQSTRYSFVKADLKEDFESIASLLVALRSAPVHHERIPCVSQVDLKQDSELLLSSSERETCIGQDSGSGMESEVEAEAEAEVDCGDDEWNERIDGSESKGYLNKSTGGFACEKHKRWKKRCPSWCPMRKENFKNSKGRTAEPIESPNTSGSEGGFPKRKRTLANISSPTSEFITSHNLSVNNAQGKTPMNTIACQFHAQLHARCPLNCPDRRLKTNVRKKQKKIEESDARRSTF